MSDAIYGVKASDISSMKEALEFLEAYGVHLEVLFERAEQLKGSLDTFEEVKAELAAVKREVKDLKDAVSMKEDLSAFQAEYEKLINAVKGYVDTFREEIEMMKEAQVQALKEYVIEANKRLRILEKGCFVSMLKVIIGPVLVLAALVGVNWFLFDVDFKVVEGAQYLIFKLP